MRVHPDLLPQLQQKNFWKNAFTLRGSVTPKIFAQVCVMMAYSSFIVWADLIYHFRPLSITPFEFTGVALGIILVFRLNAGHDRWWEARKIWGSIVNQSRNLGIIIVSYVKADHNAKKNLLKMVAALPYLMKNHLRQEADLHEIAHLLNPEILEILKTTQHRPNVVASLIARSLDSFKNSGRLDSFAFLESEKQRSILIDCQGACERILKTPIPFVMSIKTRRFILIFLLILPIALVNKIGFYTPFISGLVAYSFFSVDRIGVELQNPFSTRNLSHLPLDGICQTIEKNILELIDLYEFNKWSSALDFIKEGQESSKIHREGERPPISTDLL